MPPRKRLTVKASQCQRVLLIVIIAAVIYLFTAVPPGICVPFMFTHYDNNQIAVLLKVVVVQLLQVALLHRHLLLIVMLAWIHRNTRM